MNEKDGRRGKPAQKSLCSEIMALDQQLLRLLLKRYNLLERIRKNGKLNPAEEKAIREAWQNDVARVSRDPALSGTFFSLLQNMSFLPKPDAAENGVLVTSAMRNAFVLSPPPLPVDISLAPPLDSWSVRAWTFMAAAAGKPLKLAPSSQSDPIVDCVKAFAQMGGSVSRAEDAVIVREGAPLPTPDKIIYVGDSPFNLYLCLAHYIGKPSHAKFSGNTNLKLADLTFLDRFLPRLHARLIHVVPKSSGLPVRVECSGLLPPSVTCESDLPAEFIEALIMAACFYTTPFAVDLSSHPKKEAILARTAPVLEKCGVTFVVDDFTINIEPGSLTIPSNPDLPVDLAIAMFLLALAEPLGGTVTLSGLWPGYPANDILWRLLISANLPWSKTEGQLKAKSRDGLKAFKPGTEAARVSDLPALATPLLTALAACATLNGGESWLPEAFAQKEVTDDFLRATGLEIDASANLKLSENRHQGMPWTAPSAEWAMAFAVAACSRGRSRGFRLANPGIITEIWPIFWTFYNKLPKPLLQKFEKPAEEGIKRRRIITNAVAVLPEPEED